MSQIGTLPFLILALALGPGVEASDIRTEIGPHGDFSITFPSSWRVVPSSGGDYGQLGLFADDPFDISIVVGSRPLDEVERALGEQELLDRMIELTMINVVKLGNEIVQVGRVAPLVDDWPAFAAVATNGDRSKIMTILRSFVRDRTYVVSTLTDNLQGSSELGATVTRVVRSLTIHQNEPTEERRADAPGRQKSFCYRW